MKNEMEEIEKQNDSQCIDNIFSLKQIIVKRLAHNLSSHTVFIDITEAYDSVPFSKLWTAMEQEGINKKTIKAVQQPISKGLKQGCCIAPNLFEIYLNHCGEESVVT